MIQVFDFIEYKKYIEKALKERGKSLKGVRTRLAAFMNCRSGYLSQVLRGKADLSLEQADLASHFFGHTEEESEYFLLLVIYGRAGTQRLKSNIEKQIKHKRETHFNLKDRLKAGSISGEAQVLFYSDWRNLAVLTALSIPTMQSKEKLSQSLDIPLTIISETLQFLENSGIIEFRDGKYEASTRRTHLGKDSPLLTKHHINWRMQSIQSIERKNEKSLHYSSVIAVSKKDAELIKSRLIQAIEEIAKIIEPSPEEEVFNFSLDLFSLFKR